MELNTWGRIWTLNHETEEKNVVSQQFHKNKTTNKLLHETDTYTEVDKLLVKKHGNTNGE